MTAIPIPSTRPRVSRCIQSEQNGSKVELAIEPATLTQIFGVSDPDVATRLLSQLTSVLHPDPTKPVDPATINHALGLIEGLGPSDTTEALTATLLVAAQHAGLDALRRGSHPDQTPGGARSTSDWRLRRCAPTRSSLRGVQSRPRQGRDPADHRQALHRRSRSPSCSRFRRGRQGEGVMRGRGTNPVDEEDLTAAPERIMRRQSDDRVEEPLPHDGTMRGEDPLWQALPASRDQAERPLQTARRPRRRSLRRAERPVSSRQRDQGRQGPVAGGPSSPAGGGEARTGEQVRERVREPALGWEDGLH